MSLNNTLHRLNDFIIVALAYLNLEFNYLFDNLLRTERVLQRAGVVLADSDGVFISKLVNVHIDY